jgi:hypothetical protein
MSEVGRNDGLGRAVDDRRRRALEFTPLAAEVARQRDACLRKHVAQSGLDGAFVLRIRVGVQEADGDRANALRGEVTPDLLHLLDVHVDDRLARGCRSRADLATPAPRHERHGLLLLQVVHVRSVRAHDLEHVTEAIRRDQPDGRRLPFENCVQHDRRPVHECRQASRRDVQRGNSRENTQRHVVELRRNLRRLHGAIRIAIDDVRKGSADVDSETRHGLERL